MQSFMGIRVRAPLSYLYLAGVDPSEAGKGVPYRPPARPARRPAVEAPRSLQPKPQTPTSQEAMNESLALG